MRARRRAVRLRDRPRRWPCNAGYTLRACSAISAAVCKASLPAMGGRLEAAEDSPDDDAAGAPPVAAAERWGSSPGTAQNICCPAFRAACLEAQATGASWPPLAPCPPARHVVTLPAQDPPSGRVKRLLLWPIGGTAAPPGGPSPAPEKRIPAPRAHGFQKDQQPGQPRRAGAHGISSLQAHLRWHHCCCWIVRRLCCSVRLQAGADMPFALALTPLLTSVLCCCSPRAPLLAFLPSCLSSLSPSSLLGFLPSPPAILQAAQCTKDRSSAGATATPLRNPSK